MYTFTHTHTLISTCNRLFVQLVSLAVSLCFPLESLPPYYRIFLALPCVVTSLSLCLSLGLSVSLCLAVCLCVWHHRRLWAGAVDLSGDREAARRRDRRAVGGPGPGLHLPRGHTGAASAREQELQSPVSQ